MIRAITERLARSRQNQKGFTLIELLVVIVVLGVLSAVVVFAVRGTGDKGRASAMSIDARTIRTAQETYCAKNGRYGSAEELVASKFLSEMPTYHQTDAVAAGTPDASGNCVGGGDPSKGAFVVTCTEAQAGCGSGGALKVGWRPVSAPTGFPSSNLLGVSFPSSQVGWAVGGRTNVLRILKYDGGTSAWTEVLTGITKFPSNLRGIDCFDTTHCVAVGDEGTIVRTADGTNWGLASPLPAAIQASYFGGVDMVSSTLGWAVDDTGNITRTTDGGTTWEPPVLTVATANFYAIQFVGSQLGWAVGTSIGPAPKGVVYRTGDGGATWTGGELTTLPQLDLRDVSFVDGQRGWATGAGGGTIRTTDGGANWTVQPSACGNRLSIEFVNPRSGWTAGANGCAISATTDGAESWTTQATLAQLGGLNGLDMLDAAHGWAVGGASRIRRFGPVP